MKLSMKLSSHMRVLESRMRKSPPSLTFIDLQFTIPCAICLPFTKGGWIPELVELNFIAFKLASIPSNSCVSKFLPLVTATLQRPQILALWEGDYFLTPPTMNNCRLGSCVGPRSVFFTDHNPNQQLMSSKFHFPGLWKKMYPRDHWKSQATLLCGPSDPSVSLSLFKNKFHTNRWLSIK